MLGVLEIKENGLVRNTYARYHICLMRVFILENDVHSSPVLGAPLQHQQCPRPFSTIPSLRFSRLVLQLSNWCFVVKVAVVD